MSIYTVEAVQEADTFTTEHGQFQSWSLAVTDGIKQYDCSLNTKMGNPGPEVGDQVEGEMKTNRAGKLTLKKSFSKPGGSAEQWKPSPRDPAEKQSIVRQHSQHMALLHADIQMKNNRWPEGMDPQRTMEHMKKLIDFYQLDAENGSARNSDLDTI